MDWTALILSLQLGALTVLILVPIAILIGRRLAFGRTRWRSAIEAALALPLLLPPTVIGYYLLVAFGKASPLGTLFERVTGAPLAFSFEGLLLASVLVNVPFAVQPIQRGFETIARDLREAAACSGMSPWATFRRVELPLAWPGIVSAVALVFAHTLGEFGVVLMVGGAIPGTTRTAAIAIYDRVQSFDDAAAGAMSGALLVISLAALAVVYGLARTPRGPGR